VGGPSRATEYVRAGGGPGLSGGRHWPWHAESDAVFFFSSCVWAQAEVIFLGQLRHPNLVKLVGYCCEDEHRLLVYEYMEHGSLENHLFKREYTLHLHRP
jgi:hypothetical protein